MSGKVKKIVSTKRGNKNKQQKLPSWNILKPDFLRDALWCENDVDFSQLLLREKRVSGEVPSTPSKASDVKIDYVDIDIDPKVMWNRLLLGRQYARLMEKKTSPVEEINNKVVEVSVPISHSPFNNRKSVLGDPTNRKRKTILRTREDIRQEMSELFEQRGYLEQVKSVDSDDEEEVVLYDYSCRSFSSLSYLILIFLFRRTIVHFQAGSLQASLRYVCNFDLYHKNDVHYIWTAF